MSYITLPYIMEDKKAITAYVDKKIYDKIKANAEKEKRSISYYVSQILEGVE